MRDGVIALWGNSEIVKLHDKLDYNILSNKNKIVYNTFTTPHAGKFRIVLPDGSQVWLNAASSIRFPTAFVRKQRRVEITGEAYFEVAKNKAMPFIICVNGAEVQVLGTHFNVRCCKIRKRSNCKYPDPGAQAQLLKSGQIKIIKGVDLDEVVGWKEWKS